MQTRESDYVQNPDYGFIRDSVISLKQEGRCYAYEKWQVEEIQKLFKLRYNKETKCKFNGWYYLICT